TGLYYVYNATGNLQGKPDRILDRYGNPVYYLYDSNKQLQRIVGPVSGVPGLTPYLAYDANGRINNLTLLAVNTAANNRTSYFQYDNAINNNLTKLIGPELCNTYFTYGGGTPPTDHVTSVTDSEGFSWVPYYTQDLVPPSVYRVTRVVDALSQSSYYVYD